MPPKDAEARAEYQKRYREAHRDRHNELNRLSKERNREKIQAKRATPEEKQKEKERHQRWLAKNPEYVADYERNRRQRPEDYSEQRRLYYEAHRQEIRGREKERYQANALYRERAIARARRLYREKREQILAKMKQYRTENAEKVRAYGNAYRKTQHGLECRRKANRDSQRRHRETKAAYALNYRQKNKKRIAAWDARYYLRNRDRILARNRQWWSEHPEKAIEYQNQRRAAIQNAPGSHTAEDILAIWERQKHKCAVKGCIYPITDQKGHPHKYQVDHVQPVTKGGSNGPENLQILCRTHNAKKNDKEALEWANEQGLLFPK